MDWDEVSGEELIDETLASESREVLLSRLPDGAPGKSDARQGKKLTAADKQMIQTLRELAFREAELHNKRYSHVFLLDLLNTLQKGGGSEHVFRYIAVHGHPANSQYKWCRVLPQHRGAKGKKYEVYKLVDIDEEIESPVCGCLICSNGHNE